MKLLLERIINCTHKDSNGRPFAIFVGVQVATRAISLVDMYVWIKTNTARWEKEQSAASAGVCWASAAAAAAVTDTCTASSRI